MARQLRALGHAAMTFWLWTGAAWAAEAVPASTVSGPSAYAGVVQAVLLAVFFVLVIRLFRRRKDGENPNTQPPTARTRVEDLRPAQRQQQTDEPTPPPATPMSSREALDRYQAAQRMWQHLSGPTATAGTTADGAAPSDETTAEFLRGAKAAYPRILGAYGRRDFDDLAQFVTPEELAVFRRQAASRPDPGAPAPLDVLLLEASYGEQREEGDQTVAVVAFSALQRDEVSGESPREVREVWRFTRTTADPKATWRLAGREVQAA